MTLPLGWCDFSNIILLVKIGKIGLRPAPAPSGFKQNFICPLSDMLAGFAKELSKRLPKTRPTKGGKRLMFINLTTITHAPKLTFFISQYIFNYNLFAQ